MRRSPVPSGLHSVAELLARIESIIAASGLTKKGIPANRITGVVAIENGGTGTTTELDIHIHVANEDLSGQVGGGNVNFACNLYYRPGSLAVYRNGQRQVKDTDYTEDADANSFTMVAAPLTGDKMVVDYIIGAAQGQIGGFGLGPFGLSPFGL